MPTARLVDHRIRAGTYGVSDITSGYAVTALAVQTDMHPAGLTWVDWLPPTKASMPPRRLRFSENADGSISADGPYVFEWRFSYWTMDMLTLWRTTFLPSGVESAAVSVMTYTEEDIAVYLNCTLKNSHFPGDGEAEAGGWKNLIWRFSQGTIIT